MKNRVQALVVGGIALSVAISGIVAYSKLHGNNLAGILFLIPLMFIALVGIVGFIFSVISGYRYKKVILLYISALFVFIVPFFILRFDSSEGTRQFLWNIYNYGYDVPLYARYGDKVAAFMLIPVNLLFNALMWMPASEWSADRSRRKKLNKLDKST